jgi:CheY-like chemotaxis protein
MRSAADTPASGVPVPVPTEYTETTDRHVTIGADGALRVVPEATVLVVDPDRVTQRFVELALGVVAGLRVVAAGTAAEAVELLGGTPVDLVIAASRLRDGDGLELRRRVVKALRLARLPFVVLSSDQRPAAKVAAFAAGVDDYLVKPCDRAELAARVTSLIARSRRDRAASRRRHASLAGDFETLPLPDLVAALEVGRHSFRIAVSTPRAEAELFVEAGRVVHARYANLCGVAAFAALLDEGRGRFELAPGGELADVERTIAISTTSLLLEAARMLDERRAGRGETPLAIAGERRTAELAPILRRPPALEAARLFEWGLTDGWSPGELSALSADELSTWTGSAGGKERCHVHLVADLATAVPALLALAEPPGAEAMLGALRDEPRALVLASRQRGDRLLDVVHLDLANPSALQASLLRSPTLLIVAPPGGEPQALAPRARAALAGLAGVLAPSVILGAGGPALDDYLQSFRRDDGAPVRCLGAALSADPGDCDLRRLLVEGLRLYALTGGSTRFTWL